MSKNKKPLSARVKVKVTLYDNLGYAFQQLANLYQLDYNKLAEKMLLSGVESHLKAINEMQINNKGQEGNEQANESDRVVPPSESQKLSSDTLQEQP